MKKVFSNNSLILFTIFPMLFLQCCKTDNECPDVRTFTYNLNDDQKSKVPYTGNETIVFISGDNDTVTFIGQGKKNYYEIQKLSGSPPNCEQANAEYEVSKIDFTSNKTGLLNSLTVALHKYAFQRANPVSDVLIVTFSNYEVGSLTSYLNSGYYTDTISTCSGVKYDVMKFTEDDIQIVYYNLSKGIVAIKDGKLWRLEK